MRSRQVVVVVATLLVACQDAPLTPRQQLEPDDVLLSKGGIPGPPPGLIIPVPPGPPPRVPVPLPPRAGPPSFLSDIIDIGAGNNFSCALRSDGVAYCWGLNGTGELGDGSLAPSPAAVEVSGPTRFDRLFVGNASACGLTSTGAAYCWGNNTNGLLGVGFASTAVRVPTPVAGGHAFVELSIGLSSTCGIATDGVTYCWGSNQFGQLGIGSTGGSSHIPIAVTNSATLGFVTVSVGFQNACALTGSGATWCWGGAPNLFGNATTVPSTFLPTAAANGAVFSSIEQGALYACGVDNGGVASCWGGQASGELGNGSFVSPVQTPAGVAGGLLFASFDANNNNTAIAMTCGVTTAGEAWCWGSNQFGQLGATSSSTCTFATTNYSCSATPLRVGGGHGFEDLATGGRHVCAVDDAGDVWCWGANDLGQLGDGTMVSTATPVRVVGLQAPQQTGSIVVSPATASLLLLGSTQQFTATALDENGTPLPAQPSFSWSSSTPAVAPVSSTGLATALTTGQTIITATAPDGSSGRAVLNVNILDPVLAFQQGWVGSGAFGDGIVVLGGLLSDEWGHSGTFTTRREVDHRSIAAANVTVQQAYDRLALARRALEFEAARVTGINPSDPRIGQMLALAGYTYLAFAETWCSGVPLDDPDVGLTTAQLLNLADARFVQALGGPIPAAYAGLATVGTARARLAMGNYAGAAAAAAAVPAAFAFNTAHSNLAGEDNFVFSMNTLQRRITLSDGEGTTGLPFRTAADPRVPFAFLGIGFNAVTPTYGLLKYTSVASPMTIASGTEARLIEAEAALQGGNIAGFIAHLNGLRAVAGLAPVVDPGSATGRIDLLFSERAFWLFATGTRLGDVRRLISQYGRAPGTVLPTGLSPFGVPYGTDANLPVPATARGPSYAGCTDRSS
jgi:alpha-tubulin suppressor-like RCC1 family protein